MQGAIEGHVLVKNTNNALPLRAGAKLISLFGYDGAASRKNNVADPGWNLGEFLSYFGLQRSSRPSSRL
jgi:beta-glucosidase